MKKTIKRIINIVLVMAMLFSTLIVFASAAPLRKLDLAFVIDTTGSMSGEINEVKENMINYLDDLSASGMDFRIAIIDYRDHPENTGWSGDYPYKVQVDFTNDYDSIINAINALSLGHGGDENETICSALIDGLDELSWRGDAGKSAILMGDAPALDPEPITGYTKAMAVEKLEKGYIGYEEDLIKAKGVATYTSTERTPVTLFTIATKENESVVSDFEYLAENTGGKSYTASESEEISGIIEEILVEIPEVVEPAEHTLTEDDYITVNIPGDGYIEYTFTPNKTGCYTVNTNIPYDDYYTDSTITVYDSDGYEVAYNDDYLNDYYDSRACFYGFRGENYTICFSAYNADDVSYDVSLYRGCSDNDYDGYCDGCVERLCSHSCHDDGFFWRIINFFNKLFGINEYCVCGGAHW